MTIKELSTADLEELLKNQKDERKNNTTPKKEYKTVINFIKDFSIQAGDVRVPTYLIYYIYKRQYTRHLSTEKVGRVAFFHTFAQHFKQVRSNGKRYYMLNESLNMSEEILEKAINYSKNYTNNKKKEV